MIIVISPEQQIENEHVWINKMLENQLDLYHIRKYAFNDLKMQDYIKAIDKEFRKQIVLHSHFHLAEDFGIERLHIREENRIQHRYLLYQDTFNLSTSTHTIEDFNKVDEKFQYAFLSPVFASISKPGYGADNPMIEEVVKKKAFGVGLIGLGGINETNIDIVLKKEADGAALMGGIWQSRNPLKSFIKCKEIEQMY